MMASVVEAPAVVIEEPPPAEPAVSTTPSVTATSAASPDVGAPWRSWPHRRSAATPTAQRRGRGTSGHAHIGGPDDGVRKVRRATRRQGGAAAESAVAAAPVASAAAAS